MKQLSATLLLFVASFSFGQSEDNEILRVAQLREDCVQRSKCEVEVYPNPSNGPVHVDAPKGAKCQVYSISGTYVGTWDVGEGGLDLTDLPSGSYIAAVNYNQITRKKRILIL